MATISTRAKSPTRAEAIARALKPGPVFNTGVLLGNWVEDRIECPKGGTFYFPPKEVIDYEKLKPELRQPDFRLNKLTGLQGNIPTIIRHDSHDSCGNYATTTDLVYNHLPKPLCGPDRRYYKRSAHQFYPQPDLMKCFTCVINCFGKGNLDEETCTLESSVLNLQRCVKSTNPSLYSLVDYGLYPSRERKPEPCSGTVMDDDDLQGNVTEWGLRKYLQHEWACTDVSDYASTLYEDTYVPPQPHQYLHRCERKARDSSFTKSFRFKMTKSKQ